MLKSRKVIVMFVVVLLLAALFVSPASAATRSGSSSGGKIPYMWGFHYMSSHHSWSTLFENTIAVSGRLIIAGSQTNSCNASLIGTDAACNADSSLLWPFNAAQSKSTHSFHKTGYTDQSFNTSYSF